MLSYSLIKSMSWFGISKILVMGIGVAAIPIFTYFLTTEEYGVVSVYLAWASILTPVLCMGLNTSVSRAKVQYGEEYYGYLSSISFLVLIFSLVFLVIGFLFKGYIISFLGMSESTSLFLFSQVVFSIYISIGLGGLQFSFNYKASSAISFLRAFSSFVLSFILIYFSFSNSYYFDRVLGIYIVEVCLGLALFIYIIMKGRVFVNFEYWKFGFFYSYPFVIGSLAFVINNQLDRILIERYLSASEAGLYSFSYSISSLLLMVAISIKQALNPWIYERLEIRDKKPIGFVYKNFIYIFLFLSIAILYVSPEIIRLMASEDYWESSSVLPWLIMATFIQILILNEQETQMYLKKTLASSLIITFGACINIILNYIYIPMFGYVGAAVTTLITYVFIFFILFFYNSFVLGFSTVDYSIYIKSLIVFSCFVGVFYVFIDAVYIRWSVSLLFFLLLISFMILQRKLYKKNKEVLGFE